VILERASIIPANYPGMSTPQQKMLEMANGNGKLELVGQLLKLDLP
jgi:hypothetical protein